jgi:polyphosphate kinase
MIKEYNGYLYYERDISWLSFNDRVLQEAADKRVPLLERLRFLSIFSSNLDEFFRVRVASLRRMVRVKKKDLLPMQNDPVKVIEEIQRIVLTQQDRFDRIYQEIIQELEAENIYIINEKQLDEDQKLIVRAYFTTEVQSYIFPVVMDGHYELPMLKDKNIYQVISMQRMDKSIPNKYAIFEMPTEILGRFYILPKKDNKTYIILLDDVIRSSMHLLFSIFEYDEFHSYTIKVTRDAELEMDTELSDNLIEKLTEGIKKRKKGQPVRFVYDERIPQEMLKFLVRKLKLSSRSLIPGGRYHNFKDFSDFPTVGAKHLVYKRFIPQPVEALDKERILFNAIAKRDYIINHPYQSFDYVIRMLREAAIDPLVKYIKITLYRVAKHSNIVQALINAVKNGVKVTVFMELQARFDEESNIYWTNKLIEAGAVVYFGKIRQKIHAKMCLIGRKGKGKDIHYGHLSTGNYNRVTARIYCDHALLTADERLTSEMIKIFDHLNSPDKLPKTEHFLLAPINMKDRFIEFIRNEASNAAQGKPAYIIAKMNSLVDTEIINELYKASQVGVKINLIVRGICCLVPGAKGLSDHIKVISIIDRFLEHARVYIFANGGDERLYLSSADWMTRNLSHRIETAFPVYNVQCKNEIMSIINLQLADSQKAREINTMQNNPYLAAKSKNPVRSQTETIKITTPFGALLQQ